MTENSSTSRSRILLLGGGLALAALGATGGWWLESTRGKLGASDKAAIERVVHDYILEHPEILPEAIEKLRGKEMEKQLAGISGTVKAPFPGAVLGNPNGKVTMVEFTDFACGYCLRSVADVEALIADNSELKVVIRELPILSPASADAARMGLAAAEQGRYPQFHHAMYAAGKPNSQTIEAAARVAGLDLERARRVIADPKIEAEIQRNLKLAQQLGFDGTPSWVIGTQLISGAVGKEALAEALAEAGKT